MLIKGNLPVGTLSFMATYSGRHQLGEKHVTSADSGREPDCGASVKGWDG